MKIWKSVTRKHVLALSYLPDLDKVEVVVLEFDPQSFKKKEMLVHYMDTPDFLLVMWDILSGRFSSHSEYKGGERNGKLQARQLHVKRATTRSGEEGIVFQLLSGPGIRLNRGAVAPLKEGGKVVVDQKQQMAITTQEARKMALQTLLFFLTQSISCSLGREEVRDSREVVVPWRREEEFLAPKREETSPREIEGGGEPTKIDDEELE